jgi:arylsulfatase A-like enzyme
MPGLMVLALVAWVSFFSTANAKNNNSAIGLSCPQCNVVFLNIELLRADFVGAIANTGYTPNIDAYFKNGIIFEDVSSPGGETFGSNTSVLTVTEPHRIKIRANKIDNFDKLEPEQQKNIRQSLISRQSIAEVLEDNGYHTVSINQGGRAGIKAFLERGFSDHTQWSSSVLFEDMVDVFAQKLETAPRRPLFILFRPTFLHNHQYRQPFEYAADRLPHTRYRRYTYERPDGSTGQGHLLKRDRKAPVEAGRRIERDIYVQQLSYGDDQLQRVFDQVSRLDESKTLVVLYANHGSALGDNGKYEHGVSYQSCIHVPVLIKHPNIGSVIRVRHATALIDLVPAIYKMLEIPGYSTQYDRSLLDDIEGGGAAQRVLIGRSPWDEYVREGDWKLLVEYSRFKYLFNLRTDPQELNDVSLQRPDIARRLESLLIKQRVKSFSNEGEQ